MQIEMTLKQLKKLVSSIQVQSGGTLYRSLMKVKPVLEESLLNNVFRKPHSDTVEIESKRELATLIARGVNHKPASARPGDSYNAEYLALKRRLGENYPHKFTEYGFWQGIDVDMGGGNSIVMKVDPGSKTGNFKRGAGDYLSYHENRRSVLKRAFLDAWQNIIDTVINNIAKEGKSF